MTYPPNIGLPIYRFSKKRCLPIVFAFLWAIIGLSAQEIDLAFLDKMPKGGNGEVPIFYFEKGQMVRQSQLETAPVLSAMMPPCSPCPTIVAILMNGCYNPAGIDPDEFILINSGGGFTLGDLQLDLPNNIVSIPANNDINFLFTNGFGNNSGTTPCGLIAGDLTKVTGCANFIAATPATVIPPNSLVIFQSSAVNGGTTVFNYGGICVGHEKCVYVVKNACNRTAGAFSNSASRTTGLAINGCSCQAYWTYPTPAGNDGDYYLTSGTSGTSSPCATAPPVPHTNFTTIPVFTTPVSPLCTASPYVLPPIAGVNLTGNQKYYTGPGGTGTVYSVGAPFAFSGPTTLYIYDPTVGCVVEKTLLLVPAVVANAGMDAVICPGGSAQLLATGGPTFAWSPGTGLSCTACPNPMASPASTTIYTVTVTAAAGGCTSTDAVSVTVGTNPVATITPAPGTIINCTTPSLTLTAGGGATYLWSTGAGGASISVTMGGTFTVTATAATGGCTGTASQIITQNTAPPVAAITNNSGTTILTCTTTQINLTATGGGTYLWSNGLGTAASVAILAAGTYTVTVTAANGCTATASIAITQNADLPVVNIATNPATTELNCTTSSIILTASSTPAGATFLWTTPGGPVTGATATASAAGNYTVTATAPGGCTAVQNVVISQNLNLPNATVSPASGTISCNTPTIALLAGSTTTGATFNWGGGNFTQTNTISAAGTFTVTVTSPANGCTATASSIIVQNTIAPGANIAPATAILTCTIPTATLTATSGDPAATFNWGNGNLSATQIAAAAGTFSVTATGANGCTSSATATVTENLGLPTISILPAVPELNCTVSQINLTASSNATGGTFTWNTTATGPVISVTTAGNYSVTVTAANGCTNSTSVLVNQNLDQPTAAVAPASVSLDCTTASAVLTASSTTTGATFSWGGGNNSPTNTVMAAGTYTVTVTAPNGCTNTASASATANFALPDAAVSPIFGTINCTNPTLVLTASSTTTGATFNWGGGILTQTNTVAAAGSFTVTITDPANGCTNTALSLISQSTAIPNGTVAPASPVLTCTDPSVLLIANSTTTGATFEWPNGSTSTSFFVNTPGTFAVTITGPNGCTRVVSTVVTQAPDISDVQIATTQTVCGSATGSITLTPTGGAPFTYNWGSQPGSGANPRLNLPLGSFTCTVTNNFGCTFEATAPVTAPNAPAITVETFPDTCGQMLGIGWLHITGGATPYIYDWGTAPGSGDTLRTGMTIGTFTVTITDGNNCSAVVSVAIDELVPPTVQATTSADFCGQNNGSVFLTITGDEPPFTINWGGQPGSGDNPRIDLPAGNYDVTVTDAVNCTETITMTVMPMSILPTAVISPQNALIDCQTPSATLVVTSNTSNAIFLWGDNSTQNTLVVTLPDVYSVTVTAANGCSNTATATVVGSTDLPDVAISPTAPTLDCNTPTVVLTASSTTTGATFDWGNGITGPTLSVNSAGNYSVTVTAPNSCTASATVAVVQDLTTPDLDVTPVFGEINCANPSVDLTANSTAAVSFLWNNAETAPTISTTTGGAFSVTVTAANGCTNAGGATVGEDDAPPDLVLSPLSGVITCTVSSLNLTAFSAAPNAAFEWADGSTNPVLTVTAGGNYAVTVTGENQCTATATAIIIENNDPPGVNLTAPSPNLTCQFPTITLTANSPMPGTTFLWQNGSTLPTFDVVAPGSFAVTATAPSGGCTSSATISIGQVTGISSLTAEVTNPSCGQTNGQILLNVAGGVAPFNFNWGGQPGSGQNPRTGLPPGNYAATVTDANACTEVVTASVIAPQPPTIGVATVGSGCQVANGSATLTTNGGTSPFSFDWGGQPGSGLNPRVNLPGGSYSVTVSDGANCTVVASVQVGQAPSPVLSATAVAANCGATDGQITLMATGGTQLFSFNWGSQPGSGDNPRTDLPGGIFTATVTDLNGCTASATATVAAPGAPQLIASNLTNATCGQPNGAASLNISGGSTPYLFNWGSAPGTGNNPRTGLPSGSFPVAVTDVKGCQLFINVDIFDSPALNDVTTEPTNAACGGQNGRIEVTATGGTAPLTYDWGSQPGGGGQLRTGLPTGVFTVTINDALGCTKTGPPTPISADPYVTGATFTTTAATCGLADGAVLVTPISGVDVFQFKWGTQPGMGENPRTKLPVGNYQVTILDGNGCDAVAFFNILPKGGPVVSADVNLADCGLENGEIAMSLVSGSGPFSYNWGGQPGSGNNPRTALPPGFFIVTVTDVNGCTALNGAEILQDSLFLATQTLHTSCGLANGQINIQTTGGTPGGFLYDWGGAPGTGDNPRFDLPAGNFSVTVSMNPACTASISTTVLPSAAAPTVSATATATTCGANIGQITLTATGGTGVLSFDWGGQPGFGGNPRTSLPAGNFTVTVTDEAACSTTASANISAPGAPTVSATATPANCGNADGSAALSISGGATPYIIDWGTAPGSGTTQRTGLPAGNFIATVTGANGCSATVSVEVLGSPPISATATAISSTCGGANGSISLAIFGGAAPYSLNWGSSPGIGPNPRTGLPEGQFSVEITDGDGCTATASATVGGSVGIAVTATATETGCGQNLGEINFTTTGGSGSGQTVDWGLAPGIGSNPRTGLPTGNFSFTVTDSNGCTGSGAAVVGSPNAPIITILNAVSAKCGDENGSVSLETSGGTGAILLDWGTAPGTGDKLRTGLPAGNYPVTATDAVGCSATVLVEILGSPPISATATANSATCGNPNGSILLQINNAVGSPAFDWGTTPGTGNNPRTGLPAGQFFVEITDADGCTATASATITSQPGISGGTASVTPAGCGLADGQISLTVSGGQMPYSFDWGASPGTGANPRTGLQVGSFTVTITDADGCVLVKNATVSTDSIKISIQTQPTTCNLSNGAASILPTGAGGNYLFDWGSQPGNGQNPRTGLPAGNYSMTVSANANCFETVDLTINASAPPPVLMAGIGLVSNCGMADGTLTVTVAGGTAPFSIDWGAQPGSGDFTRTNLPVGLYFATVTDATGCTGATAASVTAPGVPILATGTTAATCGLANGTAEIYHDPPQVPKTFDWGIAPGLGDSTRTGLPAGNYVVTVTFTDSGCTASVSINIGGSPALSATAQTSPTTCGGANGSVLLQINGTPSGLNFDWGSQAGTGQNPRTNLPAGQFVVTISDANGCTALASATVASPVPPTAAVQTVPADCGQTNGSASLTIAGGTGNLTINWGSTPGSGQNPRTNLPPGSYIVVITDQNNCTASVAVNIGGTNNSGATNLTVFSCEPASVGKDTAFLKNQFGCDSLVITSTVLNAFGQINLTAATCDPAMVGVDTVLLQTANGCDSLVITTTVLDLLGCSPDFTAFLDPVKCHDEASGRIRIKPSQGLLPMTYDWLHIQTGTTGSGPITDLTNYTTITDLLAGAYVVKVTSANGLTVEKAFGVSNVPAISLTINVLSDFGGFAVRCSDSQDGQAEAIFQGAILPVIYQWSGGGATQNLDNLPSGQVNLTLTDANGCTVSATNLLDAPPPLSLDFLVKNERCAGESNGEINLGAGAGGVSPHLFGFENGVLGSETNFGGLAPGNYSLEMEDAKGCQVSETATVLPGNIVSLTLPQDSATIFSGDSLTLALANPVASIVWNPPFQVWQNGASSVVFAPLTSLFYQATIMDSAGCSGTDGIYIWVKNGRQLFAPTALRLGAQLSPNDYFTIFTGDGVAEIEVLQVFDRWGELVFSNINFQPSQPELGWDGRFRGDFVQPGVFIWRAKLRLTDGRVVEDAGGVTILK